MLSNDGQFRFEDGEERPIEDELEGEGSPGLITTTGKLLLLLTLLQKYRRQYAQDWHEAHTVVDEARQTLNAIDRLPKWEQEDAHQYSEARAQMGLYSTLQQERYNVLQMLDQLLTLAEIGE